MLCVQKFPPSNPSWRLLSAFSLYPMRFLSGFDEYLICIISFLFFHKPAPFIVEQLYLLTSYPADVPDTQSSGFQRCCPPDIQYPVNLKYTPVFPGDGPGPDVTVQIKICINL